MVSARARKAAEAAAAEDAALLAALQSRDVDVTHTPPAPPRRPTIGDNFVAATSMIAAARKETRLSETTLVKLYELNLMWALNNRATVDQNVFREDELSGLEGGGEPGEPGDEGLPEPNEVITGDDEENPTNG